MKKKSKTNLFHKIFKLGSSQKKLVKKTSKSTPSQKKKIADKKRAVSKTSHPRKSLQAPKNKPLKKKKSVVSAKSKKTSSKISVKSTKSSVGRKSHSTAVSSKKSTSKKTSTSKKGVSLKTQQTLHSEPKLVASETRPHHEPVMVEEVFEALQLPGKKIVVDGTLGLGGHAHVILSRGGEGLRLFGFDLDEQNLALAREKLQSFGERANFIRNNFKAFAEELETLKVKGIDALLLDLGLSSPQVDEGERGFSFLREGPLDMRFDKSQQLTAAEVINKYSEKELLRIFREYGEEPKARKIVQEIIRRRRHHPFTTTTDLANFIEKLLKRQGHIHPATRVFQALRMEVNKELDSLQGALEQAVKTLKKGGRIVVIAYHSLEDRLVKNFFKQHARDFINLPNELTTTLLEPTLKIITKKPLTPTQTEMSKNPRSRSAKLRVAEKL